MPGKVRRAALYNQILRRHPVLALGTGKHPVRLTHEQHVAFFEAIALGLFERLRRRNDQEGEYLLKAIEHLERSFSLEAGAGGIEKTKAEVCRIIARSSIPTLKRIAQSSALQLAEEASLLESQIPPKSLLAKRERWVQTLGLSINDALENDADLIERILRHRHKMSLSRIHKILAQANRFTH